MSQNKEQSNGLLSIFVYMKQIKIILSLWICEEREKPQTKSLYDAPYDTSIIWFQLIENE